MRVMRTILSVAILIALATPPAAAQQTILGAKFKLKEKPGLPTSRQIEGKARETNSPNTLTGDPATNGASVTFILNGATPSNQTFTLPGGAAWKRYPSDLMLPPTGWRYKDSKGLNSSLSLLELKLSSQGKFWLKAKAKGRYGSGVSVVPPNPGTYAGVVATINGAGGDTYCVNFGGAAGGNFTANTEKQFAIKVPTAESVCPSLTPNCGDGIAQPPYEACDVGDDAACPGLCGANGYPCQCPLCGDGVVDPAEACDGAALGSCTEGCSYSCTCTTCGNDIEELPIEDCDGTDDFACPGMCAASGSPNQCRCPACGDNIVNAAGEVCDGTDDGACPGLCIAAGEANECRCPVCGDNSVNAPGEVCDGYDDSACYDNCVAAGQPNECMCAVCGNNVRERYEDCDGTDDANCPGMCSIDCDCP